ncbi:MAG TPA: Rnf-Nqr domain containing protein [Chitinivibrionales bacterium]|jgi:electron transport complex protein RnfA|nr:Rnf-Nqr domain containing protein [Chitinivibrionales bacterium]
MNVGALLELSAASILANNIVLSRCIGVCPLCGATGRLRGALGMGLSATVVMTVSSALAWAVDRAVLGPLDARYLRTFVFVMSIMSLTLAADLVLRGLFPALHRLTGPHLPALASNCAVIAAALLSVQPDPVTHGPMVFPAAVVTGFATGIGFSLATVLAASIRQRLEFSAVPKPLKGLPVTFLSVGLLSLAFMGFCNLHLFHGLGW